MIQSLFEFLVGVVPTDGFHFGLGMPSTAVGISLVLAAIGAAILGKFTSNIGFATVPMNYGALYVGALAGNWLLAGSDLNLEARLTAPLLFALAGMTVMALSMMLVLRRD